MNRRSATFRTAVMLVILGAACATPTPAADAPEWLAGIIAELQSEPVANPPATILMYQYQGRTVYYLRPRCCDVASTVYDSTGAIICSADGGLTGKGDGRCPDFFEKRTDEKLVWHDERSPD